MISCCSYPQTKRRTETARAEKTADVGRSGRASPAARMAGTPRGAGIARKKKGPETIQALGVGGGQLSNANRAR